MSMNVYGLIQSVIKKPGGPRSRFYLHLLLQKRASGPLSDRLQRRKVIVAIGSVIIAIGVAIPCFMPNEEHRFGCEEEKVVSHLLLFLAFESYTTGVLILQRIN